MAYYDQIAKGYDELHEIEQLQKLEIIRKKCSFAPKQTLLDVGCGTGIATAYFPCKAVGIDPSRAMIGIAKKKHPNAQFIVGESEHLPFKHNEFDIVLSLTAIQNFHDIRKGLEEIERVGRHVFVLSFLKKSDKSKKIVSEISQVFRVTETVEEAKDMIIFAEKKA